MAENDVHCPFCGAVIGKFEAGPEPEDEQRDKLVAKHQQDGKCKPNILSDIKE